jgi:hypothetical protein
MMHLHKSVRCPESFYCFTGHKYGIMLPEENDLDSGEASPNLAGGFNSAYARKTDI